MITLINLLCIEEHLNIQVFVHLSLQRSHKQEKEEV